MDYLELIFKSINIHYLNKFIFEYLQVEEKNVTSSHFYDEEKYIDVEFSEVKDLQLYFENPTTCYLYLDELSMGFIIREVIIIISSDGDSCDVTINFNNNQFYEVSKCDLMKKINIFFERILYICEIVKVNYVLFGYEPAEDDDMMMIKFNHGHMEIYNESLQRDYIYNAVYEIVRSRSIK